MNSSQANITLEGNVQVSVGHEKDVNCVAYYYGSDKPYLVSGSDDLTIRVWDYQNKTCVQVMQGHTGYVTSIAFHPELPLIVSCSEDGKNSFIQQQLNSGIVLLFDQKIH